jgi:hypothetical protein
MIIWIIEDEAMYLKEAREALDRLARQIPVRLEIKSSRDWQWPPELTVIGQAGSEKADEKPLASLPDILILDLFQWAKDFRGKTVYERLREQERSDKKRRGAFVIIWSNYWSDPASIDFVTQTREKDGRFIALETKATSLLEEAIKGCIGRIEEER